MEHNVNQRNSLGQTALMTACKTGNVAAVREILKWRNAKGKRVNISARDENGQTALSLAKQSNNAEIIEIIDQNLFLRAVENGDTKTVKAYLSTEESNLEVLYRRPDIDILTDNQEHNCEQMGIQSHDDDLIEDPPPKRFKAGIETELTSKDSITRSVWSNAVTIAQHRCSDEMLTLLYKDDRFIHGFNEDGRIILHQLVTEYFEVENFRMKLRQIEILFKSGKFRADVSNVHNEAIFEMVCKTKQPKYCSRIDDLLKVFLQNGIDLNGRNKNGETFLILASLNGRFDIVRSLLKLASPKFDLDIDAVDNSGETALTIAKRNHNTTIVGALLGKKLISAFDDENEYAMVRDDQFLLGFNEDELTTFYEVVAEYLGVQMKYGKMKTIENLLNSLKSKRDFLNLQHESIFEVICKLMTGDLLQILLRNGIDLNCRNKNGETFLMLACKRERFDIVRSLLKLASREFDLDIDAVDNSGETALTIAKRNHNKNIVAALLGKKLILAVEDENEDAMVRDDQFLLGFNEDEKSTFYEVVAEYLKGQMWSGKMKTIENLLNSLKSKRDFFNLQHETIFEVICKSMTGGLVQILLRNGIDLNCRNKNGETFLMRACEKENIGLYAVQSLLDLASTEFVLDIDIVDSLLDLTSSGFVLDIDAVDNSGETAFMKAKKKNFFVIVDALLEFKLISAVQDENVDVVKSMLAEFRNALYISEKSWSWNQEHSHATSNVGETKSDILLEAMYIAMENNTKYSEEILKLLLDCDILLSQEISFYKLMHGWQDDDDKKLRLIELLLKSGKINVNDRDEYGRTALHWAKEETLTSLFIHYGANVNRKDNEGKTPLMAISDDRDTYESLPGLWTLLEKAGTLVNLDAVDCNGRTALMHAVIERRSHDVELLLNKGASVNLSAHLGTTALHYALFEDLCGDVEFWRNSEELRKIKETGVLLDTENKLLWDGKNEWSEKGKKIVEMLLQRPDIDVNLLSIEKFSPLDIAEVQIPEIPSSIKNALKEKGAVLNFFQQTESQSTSDFHLDFTEKLTLALMQMNKTLQELEQVNMGYLNFAVGYDFFEERLLTLIEIFIEQKVSDKDQQGRTALHLAAISFYTCSPLHRRNDRCRRDLANAIVDKLISLGCSVNETDIFGRTPLHYADEILWKLLISKGADASIKDKDGNIAIDKTTRDFSDDAYLVRAYKLVREVNDRMDETYLLRLMKNKQMEIQVQCVDESNSDSDGNCIPEKEETVYIPRLLWEKGEYAFRHPLFQTVAKGVRDLMAAIAKEIERLDPRFNIKPILVGSSNEGTKIDKPDEFDFCFVLTKISELCGVSQSPELPTGFVHLKRRPKKVDETSDFDCFFGNDGILNTVKLSWQFATILRNTLVNIERQQKFEWILKNKIYSRISEDSTKVLNIELVKPLNFFSVDEISVDIVPCIHIDDWWPDDAICNVSDDIKNSGCNLVFEGPRKLYPWVPYSESCARISFAKAESDMIQTSCDNAREAYMIAKMVAENSICYVSKYILKNCLLYCIEALSPSSEKAFQLGLSFEEMKSKFHQMDRYLWLKCFLKCHLEFVAQDFCPCYFLPNFSTCSVISDRGLGADLKVASFLWIADRSYEFPKSCRDVCAQYRCTSNDVSESSYQLPAPDPLWERFDRKQLIASLCEIAYK